MTFFSNSGQAGRPWPLKYNGKVGGSYSVYGQGLIWGPAMAKDSTLISYRWTNTDYDLVIWGVGAQIIFPTVPSTATLIALAAYKATNFTAMDTGGVDVTSTFGEARSSTMPALSSFAGLTVRMASAGATGLTAGTRTLGNLFWGDGGWTGTAGLAKPGTSRDFSAAPIILHANEGSVIQLATALASPGTILPTFFIDMDIVPAGVADKIYG